MRHQLKGEKVMRKVLASSVVVLMVLFLSAGLGLAAGKG
jgi:hypothetical protein